VVCRIGHEPAGDPHPHQPADAGIRHLFVVTIGLFKTGPRRVIDLVQSRNWLFVSSRKVLTI
jgi:hypothetical protein